MICASDDPEHAIVCDRSSRCTVNVLWVRVRDAITVDPRFDDPRRPRAAARRRRRRPQGSTHHIVTDSTASNDTLVIRGLRVAPVANPETEILQGIDLEVGKGEVHAIMGPNGSGKTTLAYALLGHPAYVVTGGEVHWKGRDILKLSPDKRARLGMFLAFQYPTAIPGLSVAVVHPERAQREAPGRRQDRRRRPDRPDEGRHLDARLPDEDAREDGPPEDGRGLREPLRQRGLQRRREEAPRDAPDGGPRAGDGDPRRDRLGPRHRRAADRRRGRQRDAQPGARRAADHPLPAAAELHHPRPASTSWPRAGS